MFFNTLSFTIYLNVFLLTMWCGIISATFLPEFSIIPLPVYLLFHSASQTHVNITVYFLSRVTEHCLGASHKYANGIHHKFESTAAAQQSVNLFLLCSFFQCLKVVIPNLYHSLQALDSLLLPSSLSVDNCQKKKKLTSAKNSLNCPLHL